jgi:hypothetical protein
MSPFTLFFVIRAALTEPPPLWPSLTREERRKKYRAPKPPAPPLSREDRRDCLTLAALAGGLLLLVWVAAA